MSWARTGTPQSPGFTSAASQSTGNFTVTVGALIAVFVYWNAHAPGVTVSISDTLHSTYLPFPIQSSNGIAASCQWFVAVNSSGGTNNVTVTQSSGTSPIGLFVLQYTGGPNTLVGLVDAAEYYLINTNRPSQATQTSGALNVLGNDLLLAGYANPSATGTYTQAGSWTRQAFDANWYSMCEDQINVSSGSVTAQATDPNGANSNWACSFIALKLTALAPATGYRQLLSDANAGGGASGTIQLQTPTEAGQLLYLALAVESTATPSLSDNLGNTYQLAAHTASAASSSFAYVYYVSNTPAGITWINWSIGSGSNAFWILAEYVGMTASPFDQSAVNTTAITTTPSVGPTGTTAQASEIALAFFFSGDTTSGTASSPTNGYTIRVNNPPTVGSWSNGYLSDLSLSAIGTTSTGITGPSVRYGVVLTTWTLTQSQSVALTTTPYLGIWSKDSVLSVGAFDMGIPISFGLFDDDFVAQFSGTTVGATATGMSSVPTGVFDRDSQVSVLGLYGAN